MTVFVLRAEADRALAERLARLAERRVEFVEEEDGLSAGRALTPRDAVILLWSRAAAAEAEGFERRALEGWAVGRLTIARLDADTPLPIPLRDLPALGPEPDVLLAAALGPPAASAAPGPARRRSGPPALALRPALALSLGLIAAALTFGGLAAAATLEALPQTWFAPAFALALMSAIGALLLALRRRSAAAPAAPIEQAPVGQAPAARELLIAFAEEDRAGLEPWIGPVAAAAGPIKPVGAALSGPELAARLGAARALIAALSPAGFATPAVRRALFLADMMGRPIIAAQLRPAPAPDEAAYHLAGAPEVALHRIAPDARAAAVAAALPPV